MRVNGVLRILGFVLLAIGLAGYLLPAGPVHWTALIPAGLGLLALLVSLLRNPAVAAGIGAVVCLLALFGGASALGQVPALLAGEAGAAAASRAATAVAAVIGLAALALATRRRAKEA
jgi:hypothetical protein